MKHTLWLAASLTLTFAGAALADEAHEGPCKEVKEACTKAGFVQGEAKEGKGLWKDCIGPIMQGTANPKSVLPLPTVDAAVVSACKQKHPNFGQGKGGK